MIVSERIKIPRDNVDSTQLLDHIYGYFSNNVTGEVLRFAIVDINGDDLVVDISIQVEPLRKKTGRNPND